MGQGPEGCNPSERVVPELIPDRPPAYRGTVVEDVGTDVLEVAPGGVAAVEVVVVLVVDVVDDVVVDVLDVVVEVVEVVVVDVGDTPSTTPPTVVPECGPPKIDDRERPAAVSTNVTAPSANTNAANADAVASKATRQRFSMAALSARRCRAAWASDDP